MADKESTRKYFFCKSLVEKVSKIFQMSPFINLIISYSLSPCLPLHHPSPPSSPPPRRMNKQAGKWDVTFLLNVGSITNTFQVYSMIIWNCQNVNYSNSALKPLPRLPNVPKVAYVWDILIF